MGFKKKKTVDSLIRFSFTPIYFLTFFIQIHSVPRLQSQYILYKHVDYSHQVIDFELNHYTNGNSSCQQSNF